MSCNRTRNKCYQKKQCKKKCSSKKSKQLLKENTYNACSCEDLFQAVSIIINNCDLSNSKRMLTDEELTILVYFVYNDFLERIVQLQITDIQKRLEDFKNVNVQSHKVLIGNYRIRNFNNFNRICFQNTKNLNLAYETLIKYDLGYCILCGKKMKLTQNLNTDHFIPQKMNGSNSVENLNIVHQFCNHKKGCKLLK